jgi:bifunctional non-homologous end joining protein LigD
VPLAWEELEGFTSSDRWTASNIQERLETGNGPWEEYEASRRSILPAMKILGFKPPKTATRK